MTEKKLPKATIVRIAKQETGLRISKDAKNKLIAAGEQFIRNVAKEASQHDFFNDKKTIQGRDIDYILKDKRYKRLIPTVDYDEDE